MRRVHGCFLLTQSVWLRGRSCKVWWPRAEMTSCDESRTESTPAQLRVGRRCHVAQSAFCLTAPAPLPQHLTLWFHSTSQYIESYKYRSTCFISIDILPCSSVLWGFCLVSNSSRGRYPSLLLLLPSLLPSHLRQVNKPIPQSAAVKHTP